VNCFFKQRCLHWRLLKKHVGEDFLGTVSVRLKHDDNIMIFSSDMSCHWNFTVCYECGSLSLPIHFIHMPEPACCLSLLFGFLLINSVLCIFPVILLYSFSIHCQVDLKVPVVVRLEGTNVDQGKRILKVRIGDNSQALC
jgi:hypothetical protein